MSEIFLAEKRPFSRPSHEIICKKCKITFSERKNLYVHIRKYHSDDDVLISGNQICGICRESFRLISQLHKHLQNKHDVNLKFVNETFYNETDFLEFKEKIEKETQSYFHLRNSNKNPYKGMTFSYYTCHRSGIYNPATSKRERHTKVSGSVKCGYTCPAIINVHKQIVDEICEIKVQYQSVHVGHDLEVGKLRLSKEERTNLASSLSLGIPLSNILDDIRKKYSPTKRYGLTTRQDLYNIKRDFKIERNVILHKEDAISVDILIKKMQNNEENPVLIYKPLSEMLPAYPAIGKDEFILGIMYDAQLKLLELYGNSCIMIDSTHGMNQYGFQLTTVMVHDENHESLPIAVLFSSKTATESLIPFFAEIKKQLPNFKTAVLMTDDTMSFYNAWQATFQDEPKHLLCSWHVNKSWTTNLNNKVKDVNNRTSMKAELKKMIEEVDVATFEKQMNSFLEIYEEKEKDFVNYFKTHYMKRSEKWAYCHRTRLGISTNMKLERWHCQIKYKERGTVVKRLDKSIALVTNAIAKKLLSRVISMERGKLMTRVEIIRKRHKASQEIGENYNLMVMDDKYIITKDEGGLLQTYDIEKASSICTCLIRCDECNICIHSFACTCIDYSIRFIICKHIHFVCRNLKSELSNTVEETEDNDLIVDAIELEENHAYEKQAVLTLLRNNCNEDNENKHKKTLNRIQDLHRRMLSFKTADVLEYVDDTINALNAYLDTAAVASAGQFGKSPDVMNAPPNKNIIQQRKFTVKRSSKGA